MQMRVIQPIPDLTDNPSLREEFERMKQRSAGNRAGFSRSRKGTYVDPALARDWKWFQLGYIAHQELVNA
jgi:hypothetical protein